MVAVINNYVLPAVPDAGMDWLTFVAAVIKAVAWPLTVLLVFTLLREPLIKLIPLLRKLKWKELEIEFEEKIIELKSEAAEALAETVRVANALEIEPQISSTLELAETSPRDAIIEAWLEVQRAARKITAARGGARLYWPAEEVGKWLLANGVLSKPLQGIYDDLRKLRNQAAHHSDFLIEPQRAKDYAIVAGQLASYLIRQGSREESPETQ